MDLLTEFDIKTVCRICLDCPEHQVSLWEYEKYDGGGLKQLAEVLMECTSVKVSFLAIISCNLDDIRINFTGKGNSGCTRNGEAIWLLVVA